MPLRASEEPPEKTKHFVLLHKRFTHAIPAEDAEDFPDEMKQDSDVVNAASAGRKVTIVYRPGDELPPDMAREVWSAFGDRIAALDGNGMRLDTPTSGERSAFSAAAADAIQTWKDGEGFTP